MEVLVCAKVGRQGRAPLIERICNEMFLLPTVVASRDYRSSYSLYINLML